MTVPTVNLTQIDGALGVLPASAGRPLAIVGTSSTGPIDTPATFARVRDVVATFGVGELVESAAHAIERHGRPVVVVRTGETTSGDYGAIDETDVAGTAVITETGSTEPLDSYEAVVRIITGGTTGVAGITYQTSLDGGRTWSATTALGTALVFPIAGSGVSFTSDTAKTLLAGDSWSCRTSSPKWAASELGSALDALKVTAINWGLVEIVGAVDPSAFDAIELKIASMVAGGKDVAWIGSVRLPDAGESEATYQASVATAFSTKASIYGALTAGAVEMTSSVSARRYVRPVSFVVAPRENSFSEEVNSADITLGPITGVSIRDDLGNPKHHDEAIHGGLDDSRFLVLRSWERRPGVFVNRPRLLSPAGSDFQLLAHRRVMNLAMNILRSYFEERLNRAIAVDRVTGFIKESVAQEIEAGANARLAAALLSKPKASDAYCVVARNENLLSTKTLSADARVVPLAYAERIELSVGFQNPALNVVAG